MVRWARSEDGRQYIDVENPRGGALRLPIDWTERGNPLVAPRVHGSEIRLSARGLVELANAVAAAVALPPVALKRNEGGDIEATSKPGEASAVERRAGDPFLEHASSACAARRDRRVGHARAETAARRSAPRRGEP